MEAVNPYIIAIQTWCRQIGSSWADIRAFALQGVHLDEILDWEMRFSQLRLQSEARMPEVSVSRLYEEANELFFLLERFTQEAEEITQFGNPLQSRSQGVPAGGHQLPPLPYAYNALEPYIPEEIMRLHHLKHHQSYVDGLNKAELEMKRARETNDFSLIKHWEREAAFHGAGHYLHTLFWTIMSPAGGGEPKGPLLDAITSYFGSFDAFKRHFSSAAVNVEGSGWALLVWSPRAGRLEILNAEKHQNLSQWEAIPILVLDMWEHAYYLKYKNDRSTYVSNWWNTVNWQEASKRYMEARKLRWTPY
ncbi:superoxide dismutase [Metabacillus sp. 84]|uniref:superoxide dismutase n=1 Tax=Metabacillus sp. 84 TaxID=3404705 RepID=UPI003CE6744B